MIYTHVQCRKATQRASVERSSVPLPPKRHKNRTHPNRRPSPSSFRPSIKKNLRLLHAGPLTTNTCATASQPSKYGFGQGTRASSAPLGLLACNLLLSCRLLHPFVPTPAPFSASRISCWLRCPARAWAASHTDCFVFFALRWVTRHQRFTALTHRPVRRRVATCLSNFPLWKEHQSEIDLSFD